MPDFIGLLLANPSLFVTAGQNLLQAGARIVTVNEEFTAVTGNLPGWTGESRQAHDAKARTISTTATTMSQALERAGTALVSGGAELTEMTMMLRSQVDVALAEGFLVMPSGMVILGPAQYAEAAAATVGAEAVIAAYEAGALAWTGELEGIVASATAVDAETAAQVEAAGAPIGVEAASPSALINGNPVTIQIAYQQGLPPGEFLRKTRALQELGDRGLLYKAENPLPPRDENLPDQYRAFTYGRVRNLYNLTNPEYRDYLISQMRAPMMNMDHTWELQLGGPDAMTNLRWLDRDVNDAVGRQIRQQIRTLPDGTPIRIQILGIPVP